MKNIQTILFENFRDRIESSPATELDQIFSDVLRELEDIDEQLLDKVLNAAAEVITEQMRMAFMAGIDAGVGISGIAAKHAEAA